MTDALVVLRDVHKTFRRAQRTIAASAVDEDEDLESSAVGGSTWSTRESSPESGGGRALKSVTLTVGPGEGVAILGPPRSGKTTLVRVIAGITVVDRGSVLVSGRCGGSLAMGVNATPDLSVADNAYVQARSVSLPRGQARSVADEALDFAGLRALSDRPYHTLPPPLRGRLELALAVGSAPDVYLSDGQLVRGSDPEYAARAMDRMSALAEAGGCLVIHDSARRTVRRLCQRGIVLDAGELVFDGGLDAALDYLDGLGHRGN